MEDIRSLRTVIQSNKKIPRETPRVVGDLGLGLRVSLKDILKGRKRDSTPVWTVVKRLGARVPGDKVSRIRKGEAQVTQVTQVTQPVAGWLRQSQRIQAGQGGKKAWCVWCGVKCRGEGGIERLVLGVEVPILANAWIFPLILLLETRLYSCVVCFGHKLFEI